MSILGTIGAVGQMGVGLLDTATQYQNYLASLEKLGVGAQALGVGNQKVLDSLGREYGWATNEIDKANKARMAAINAANYGDANSAAVNWNNYSGWLSGDAQRSADAYGGRTKTALGMLDTAGQQEKIDIAQQYRQRGADVQAGLRRRGLAGTTIAPTMQLAVDREQADAMGRVNERVAGQKAGMYAGLSGEAISSANRYRDAITEANRMGAFDIADRAYGARTTGANMQYDTTMAPITLRQQYGEAARQVEQAYPDKIVSLVTGNPIEFPNYSGLSQGFGALSAYDATNRQLEEARNARKDANRANAWSMGLAGANTATNAALGAGALNAYGQRYGVNPWNFWN